MNDKTKLPSAWLETLGLEHSVSRVLILGAGVTGLSVARKLARENISYAVVDSRANPPGIDEFRQALPDAPIFLNGLNPVAFSVATHLVVSPGVSLELPEIQQALARGVKLLSDIDLFRAQVSAPIVAITGSNGKSTVTTMLALMIRQAGLVAKEGANLGTPALDLIDDEQEPDFYVLELSSFQLERTQYLAPLVAAVLNLSPDHMDRYRDFDEYAAAKARIFEHSEHIVLNQDDDIVRNMAIAGRAASRYSLDEQSGADYLLKQVDGRQWLARNDELLIPAEQIRIRGQHNLANALATLAMGDAMGLPRYAMLEVLQRFPGLPHRMQWVAEQDQVTWLNDSKATNVGACLAALEGLPGPVVLIAGGDGKGADFSALLPAVKAKARAVVLMGRDAGLLEELFKGEVPLTRVKHINEAVRAAAELAKPGDTVLLSPACASLDQFKDYQARGQAFSEAVRGIAHVSS